MKMIYKMMSLVGVITVIVVAGGATIGIPVLSWLYNIELKPYRLSFIILLLGGGINGIISILTYVITVWRKQKVVLYVYAVIACIVQVSADYLVRSLEITGAALVYSGAMLCICIGFMLFVWIYVKKMIKNN